MTKGMFKFKYLTSDKETTRDFEVNSEKVQIGVSTKLTADGWEYKPKFRINSEEGFFFGYSGKSSGVGFKPKSSSSDSKLVEYGAEVSISEGQEIESKICGVWRLSDFTNLKTILITSSVFNLKLQLKTELSKKCTLAINQELNPEHLFKGYGTESHSLGIHLDYNF